MRYAICSILLLAGCSQATNEVSSAKSRDVVQQAPVAPSNTPSALAEAKRGYQTKLQRREKADLPVIVPPTEDLELVNYTSPLGPMPAYISKTARTAEKHPAIVWIVGGFDNSVGEVAWEEADPHNDQSAQVFREMGIVTMYPSMRGGNQNPGYIENLYGEVDDVVAAARFLATVEYVDPNRIYLGGHSTGGTLALLVAASTDLFRAVFALGPVGETVAYGPQDLNFDVRNQRERELRAPVIWLGTIRTPTFVIEGTEGNIRSLRYLQEESSNENIQFLPVEGCDHFSVIAPVSRVIARKILADVGKKPDIVIVPAELESVEAR